MEKTNQTTNIKKDIIMDHDRYFIFQLVGREP